MNDHQRDVKRGVAMLEAMTEDERTKYAKDLIVEAIEAARDGSGTAQEIATAIVSCINIRIGDTLNHITRDMAEVRAAMLGEDDDLEPKKSFQ